MNFDLAPEQQQLADSVSKYLANEYSFEKRKAIVHSDSGVSETVWQTFAEMGLTAMTLSEADDGFGGGAMDLMAVMESMGEALVVEPFLENVALAGRLVSRLGSAAQRAAHLPGLIDGSARLAFASLEPGRRYALAPQASLAKAGPGGWVLNGHKCMVTGAASAHKLVVSALTPAGVSLFIVDAHAAGVTLNPSRTVDGFRVAEVTLSDVVLGSDAILGADGAALPFIEEAADFATALLCAEAIGAFGIHETAQAVWGPDCLISSFATPYGGDVHQYGASPFYGNLGCKQSRRYFRCQGARARCVRCKNKNRGCRTPSQPRVSAVARWHGYD
jgi:alkylation response protein AidB-like acyl-CoA dehydrogenase